MAVIFLSHSTKDDEYASAVERWLRENAFTDIFVDHENIAGGEKWRDALRQATNSCRVVLCLVTVNWLSSAECFGEFMAAWYMGRRIIPLILLPGSSELLGEEKARFDRVCGEDQGIDLVLCLDANGSLDIARSESIAKKLTVGLRSAGANTRIGLDPEAFAIDTRLREYPFPGLASFGDDDADAALFYGRSREIAHVLEDLRSMRALNDNRPLVVHGASGAGKSSLLKGGVIPRLRREIPAWLPLRVFRPGGDPLLNFSEALSRTLSDFGQREAYGVIRDRLREAWETAGGLQGSLSGEGLASIGAVIELEAERLRRAADRPGASILITVDQAEELARADSDSSAALADYLSAALLSTKGLWQLVFTIRTDSFPELQKHRRFQNLEGRGYDLRAIPVFRFDSVVEQPAKRYGVEVDVALVDALMEDAPKEDALPLLAFALQRLWRQYAASGSLNETHYRNFGGLDGLVEDAAERALHGLEPDQDLALPMRGPSIRLLELARATFVPALVQINERGAAIKRTAAWKSFSDESQELLDRFDRWRLVIRRGQEEQDGGTVEVAHEALFRKWGRLEEWLRPERARLEALRCLQTDTAIWKRKERDPSYLNHRELRLAEAESLTSHPTFAGQIGDDEHTYLAACKATQQARRRQARRGKTLLIALGLMLIVAVTGWWRQAFIKEQYQWRFVMVPSVLRPDLEKTYANQPGAEFTECAFGCPKLVVVSADKFLMGAEADEGASEELPQHPVTFTSSFALGKVEVTIGEWNKCVAAGACRSVSFPDGWGEDNYPVINVSWHDAEEYVSWLSRMTGKHYRLPSEAEWEYAARARSTTRYSFGDDKGVLGKYAWYFDNAGERTHQVGLLDANAFGLKDMHGNVWEWCKDTWHPDYYGAPDDGRAWSGGVESLRVVRGGAWDSLAAYIRSAYRSNLDPAGSSTNVGFRVLRTFER
jgi:formylglycine-generating enzyme required for sulfatase activity